MRQVFNRFQLLFVSIILLLTFIMLMAIVLRFNQRWDTTEEKLYTLAPQTRELLNRMQGEKIEVLGFYPHDPHREDLELFLKQCSLHHKQFDYTLYNPHRRPQLAHQLGVKELYTLIIRYGEVQEKIILPDEESFAGALLRLLEPRVIPMCFLVEPGDERLFSEKPEGFNLFRGYMDDAHFEIKTLSIEQKYIPKTCRLVMVPGPQSDWEPAHLDLLKEVFDDGGSVLFLIDPMDPGTGEPFVRFFELFGIRLDQNVIVDKMSRMVGGDFLLPFVNQYDAAHAITANFKMPTFYPVARSVRSSATVPEGLKVLPLAFSGSNSWGETNLSTLESGEATFEIDSDLPGPVPLFTVVEAVNHEGRMTVVGDSDFLTNTYLPLSGNKELMMRALRWLSRDERYVKLENYSPRFQPLFIHGRQRLVMLTVSLLVYPLFFLLLGLIQNYIRRKSL